MTLMNFTFQESSPVIDYSAGQWLEINPALDPSASNYSLGSAEVTDNPDTAATVTFTGTGITIFGAKRTNHGNYSVSLDNGPLFIGNGNEDNIFQTPLWSAQNLVNTQHTVVITNLPTSQGNWLDLDFVTIVREIGPLGYTGSISNVTLDDQSSFIEYNGSWSSFSSSSALNSSLHKTVEEGSSLTMFFHGSSIEFYGLYVNAPFQVKFDDQPTRNIAGENVNTTWQPDPQTLLLYADGLDENKTHVVTLTNAISDFESPFYFDYAIVRGSQAFFEANPTTESVVPTSTPVPMTSAPTATDTGTGAPPSRPVPGGTIIGSIVGSIGGLVILAFVGFIFLRRSRFYRRSTALKTTEESNVRPSSSVREYRNGGITPFVFPSESATQESRRRPARDFKLPPYTNPRDHPAMISTIVPAVQPTVSVSLSSQPQTDASITHKYKIREIDAGPLLA